MVLFERLQKVPLTKRVSTSESCVYFYRSMMTLGWLPPEQGIGRWIYMVWTITTTVAGIYLPIGLLVAVVSGSNGNFLNSLNMILSTFANIGKAYSTYSSIWRMKKITKLLDQLDVNCVTLSQREKLHRCVVQCNQAIFFYVLMYLSFSILLFIAGFFTVNTPWQLYNPFFDRRKNFMHLVFSLLIELFVYSVAVIQEQQSDCYPLIFSLIFRSHINILKDRIQNLRTNDELSNSEHYDELVSCIQDHNIILRCVDIIKPAISMTIFIQFMLVGIVLGISAINIMIDPSLWNVAMNVAYSIDIIIESFPFCINCEFIIADCNAMSDAVFHSNWIDADQRYKKTLLYFLHKTQYPIRFVAGGIIKISVESNLKLAKFALSIIAVAKQMNLADNYEKNA